MMQQNRDRNGRPRNARPYDLNRDVVRTSAPSQNNTPRSTGSSRYGYNGEPLSRPPSRSANGSVRASRADNSIQFPTQPQTRRPAQVQGSNTAQSGSRPAGSRPKNAKSGGKQHRPANNARSGQGSRNPQNYQNAQNHPYRLYRSHLLHKHHCCLYLHQRNGQLRRNKLLPHPSRNLHPSCLSLLL